MITLLLALIACDDSADVRLGEGVVVLGDDTAGDTDPSDTDPSDTDPGDPTADIDEDGYTPEQGDCDDNDATAYPGSPYDVLTDGSDQNCDGVDGRDGDGDGYATDAGGGDDCDDADDTRNPGATETCNEIDDDCDGVMDDGAAVTFYVDDDGDGYGASDDTTTACDAPSGYVANDDDCDDSRALTNPDATEFCNGEDDNCDGTTDEDSADDASTFYVDDDNDGYGDFYDVGVVACDAPSGYSETADDCDDTDDTDIPDGIDTDCDGDMDLGISIEIVWDSSVTCEEAYGTGYHDGTSPIATITTSGLTESCGSYACEWDLTIVDTDLHSGEVESFEYNTTTDVSDIDWIVATCESEASTGAYAYFLSDGYECYAWGDSTLMYGYGGGSWMARCVDLSAYITSDAHLGF